MLLQQLLLLPLKVSLIFKLIYSENIMVLAIHLSYLHRPDLLESNGPTTIPLTTTVTTDELETFEATTAFTTTDETSFSTSNPMTTNQEARITTQAVVPIGWLSETL